MRCATASNRARSTCNAAVGITDWKSKPDRSRQARTTCAHQGALRLGLRLIKGLGEAAGLRIETNQPFRDSNDLATRAELSATELGCLARAGALAALSGHRYQAHWDVAGIQPPAALWKVADQHGWRITPTFDCPAPTVGQDLLADYSYLTLTLGPHPLRLLRDHTALSGCRSARQTERIIDTASSFGWPVSSPAGNGRVRHPASCS